MKVYGSRKSVRKHVKEIHKIKGGKDSARISRTPLSEYYMSKEVGG